MKSTIGLYGKIIIVGIVAAILLQVISPSTGVMKLIPKANATYRSETAKDLVLEIQQHKAPVFSGNTSTVKLKAGEPFNLLDLKQVGIQVDCDKQDALKVEVTEILDQWDRPLDVSNVTSFVPPAAGSYYVTYRAFYEHLGTTLETSKQYTLKAY